MVRSTDLPPPREREQIPLPPPSIFSSTAYSPDAPSPLSDFTEDHDRISFADDFLNRCRASAVKLNRTGSPQRQLQKSFAAFANSFPSSPDLDARRASRQLFGDFFSGSSTPASEASIRGDHSVEEPASETDMDGLLTRGPRSARRSTVDTDVSKPQKPLCRQPTMSDRGSRFSWFPRPTTSRASHARTTSSIDGDDPLLTMSIANVLFPHGNPDPFAPHSFHDLVDAATSLLATFQSAYRAQHAELENVRREHSALQDEFAEMETRSRHLKSQLREMASSLDLCEAEKKDLKGRLQQEQEAAVLRDAARERGLDLAPGDVLWPRPAHVRGGSASTAATIDSGFESDVDSPCGSVRSKFGGAASIASTGSLWSEPGTPGEPSPTASNRRTMLFDDVLDVMRKKENPNHLYKREYRPAGSGAQSAFMANSNILERNAWLEQRVFELESAVDSCLDLIC